MSDNKKTLSTIMGKGIVGSMQAAQNIPSPGALPATGSAALHAQLSQMAAPQSSGDTIRGALARLFSLTSGSGNNEVARIDAITAINDIAKTFGDVKSVFGNLVSFSPELTLLNQNSYSFAFEPDLVDRATSDHVPYDVNVRPQIFSFDADGNGSLGGTPFSSASLESDLTGVLNLGWLFMIQGNNTLVGQASAAITMTSGVVHSFMLKDSSSTGTAVILNNTADASFTVSNTTPSVTGGVLKLATVGSAAAVVNQYYQSFDNKDMDCTITGQNVVIYAYPIFNQRSISGLAKALVYTDQLPAFADYVRIAAASSIG